MFVMILKLFIVVATGIVYVAVVAFVGTTTIETFENVIKSKSYMA